MNFKAGKVFKDNSEVMNESNCNILHLLPEQIFKLHT